MPISKNTKFDQESPVRNGNYHADFFYLFCLHWKIRISIIRLVSNRWVESETLDDL